MNYKVNEAASDMFRANLSRFGQGIKNILGAGDVTTDSKDKGVQTLFLRFKDKFEKITPSVVTSPTLTTPSGSVTTSGSTTSSSSSVTPITSPTGSVTVTPTGSVAITGSVTGSTTPITGSTSTESREFITTPKNLNTDLIKIFQQPKSDNITINSGYTAVYKISPILVLTSSTFKGNIDILGLVNNNPIDKKYIGTESRGQFLEYWIKSDFLNNYSTISSSINNSISYKVLYSNLKSEVANKNAGTSYSTSLIINPAKKPIIPESNFLNESLNKEQTELYLDFLKDLSWYFKIQPNPDMSSYNPENVINWMKSQGERFKYIIDYINQKVIGTSTSPKLSTSGSESESDGLSNELKAKLDEYITEEFLRGLTIIYPEKILNSKLNDNSNTRLPNDSKTLMAFKIENDNITSYKIKCNIKNKIRFEFSLNSSALKSQEPKLFTEIKLVEVNRLGVSFKRKLINTLAIEFSKNPTLSKGKNSNELNQLISIYLSPKIDEPIGKMIKSIFLTLKNIIHINNKLNDIIFVGINQKQIKFIKNNPIPENKLFESIHSKNKNIFKLR